ncbi:MAG: peptidase T [Spirochaetales bacterium]|nr:peptidase T [Spirochaetales bacterium]
MKNITDNFKEGVLERFLRYARIHTTSALHVEKIPSTDNQWVLLNLLVQELKELGVSDVSLNESGYLIARLPSNRPDAGLPTIGLMAHVDTSSDMTGDGVNPQLHENYDGKVIELGGGYALDPEEFPDLLDHVGDTVITTDGTTLLGADDKAGIAEIMTALEWLIANPDVPRGDLEIMFTPDEETGKGMDLFPRDEIKAEFAYTIDGGREGEIEGECFNAYQVDVKFTGRVIHLGAARGKLVNAVTMASTYINMLPQAESPEATDERYGYYCPFELNAGLDEAELLLYLRDFDLPEMMRRIETCKTLGKAVEAIYPGSKVEVKEKKMYLNMREHMNALPQGMEFLEEASRLAGVEPVQKIIRGGTDGSRLSEMGIPTPNVFTGGFNYHSRFEWASLSTMNKSVKTIIYLCQLWGSK